MEIILTEDKNNKRIKKKRKQLIVCLPLLSCFKNEFHKILILSNLNNNKAILKSSC